MAPSPDIEESIAFLVVIGLEESLELLQKNGSTREAATAEVLNLVDSVQPADLLRSEHFMDAIYLAFFIELNRETETATPEATKERLSVRLAQIFSITFAEELAYIAYTRLRDARRTNSNETIAKDVENLWWQHKKFINNTSDFFSEHPDIEYRKGVTSKIVRCPTCGIKRRCDASTKWFRCKCGTRPYSFSRGIETAATPA